MNYLIIATWSNQVIWRKTKQNSCVVLSNLFKCWVKRFHHMALYNCLTYNMHFIWKCKMQIKLVINRRHNSNDLYGRLEVNREGKTNG